MSVKDMIAAIATIPILALAISTSRGEDPSEKPVCGTPRAERSSEAADRVDRPAPTQQQEAESPEQQSGHDEKNVEELVDVGAEMASHQELAPLAVEFQRLSSLRMAADGNLLACDETARQVKVIGPTGRSYTLPRTPSIAWSAMIVKVRFSANGEPEAAPNWKVSAPAAIR